MWTLETIPMRHLMKCRLCAFKKRSCFLCSSSCTALLKRCARCGKVGHYPKSKKCSTFKIVNYKIPQIDGGIDEDESKMKKDAVDKKIYASNCDIYEISVIINFQRNCIHLWTVDENHKLCPFYEKHREMSCMYCLFRSCCIRISSERKRGPKRLKPYEIVHQLFKFESLQWDWRKRKSNLVEFVLNTLKLLRRNEKNVIKVFGVPDGECDSCHLKLHLNSKYIFHGSSSDIKVRKQMIAISEIIKNICKSHFNECCVNSMILNEDAVKYIFVYFEDPI